MVRSNSHPASTVRPLSRTSRRKVAATGRIQPVISASKKGMQRLIVRPLLVGVTTLWSTGGNLRNQAGTFSRAG
jgi:hypothetical protein